MTGHVVLGRGEPVVREIDAADVGDLSVHHVALLVMASPWDVVPAHLHPHATASHVREIGGIPAEGADARKLAPPEQQPDVDAAAGRRVELVEERQVGIRESEVEVDE